MNIPSSEIDIPSINENNHCEPNNVNISGALFTLNLGILILSAQYGEGARDVNNIRVTMITNYLKKPFIEIGKIYYFRGCHLLLVTH